MRLVPSDPETVELEELAEISRYGAVPGEGWSVDHLSTVRRDGAVIGQAMIVLRRRDGTLMLTYRPRPRPRFDTEQGHQVARGRIPCGGRGG